MRELIGAYVGALSATFRTLGHKYLLTGRDPGIALGALQMDRVESGFPVFAELLMMANDALAGGAASGPYAEFGRAEGADDRRDRRRTAGAGLKLQYAMSQRLYYEALAAGGLYWAQNDPVAIWAGETAGAAQLRRCTGASTTAR